MHQPSSLSTEAIKKHEAELKPMTGAARILQQLVQDMMRELSEADRESATVCNPTVQSLPHSKDLFQASQHKALLRMHRIRLHRANAADVFALRQ